MKVKLKKSVIYKRNTRVAGEILDIDPNEYSAKTMQKIVDNKNIKRAKKK